MENHVTIKMYEHYTCTEPYCFTPNINAYSSNNQFGIHLLDWSVLATTICDGVPSPTDVLAVT